MHISGRSMMGEYSNDEERTCSVNSTISFYTCFIHRGMCAGRASYIPQELRLPALCKTSSVIEVCIGIEIDHGYRLIMRTFIPGVDNFFHFIPWLNREADRFHLPCNSDLVFFSCFQQTRNRKFNQSAWFCNSYNGTFFHYPEYVEKILACFCGRKCCLLHMYIVYMKAVFSVKLRRDVSHSPVSPASPTVSF